MFNNVSISHYSMMHEIGYYLSYNQHYAETEQIARSFPTIAGYPAQHRPKAYRGAL